MFLCGPGSMIKETRNALLALGLPRETGASRVLRAAAAARIAQGHCSGVGAPASRSSQEWKGTEAIAILDGLRHQFTVPPGGHVVDAALAAGIRVPYSCKGGMCCTCRAKLVEGKAEMTTNYSLEPWEIERGFILTCQAVPKSDRLVLDYDQM